MIKFIANELVPENEVWINDGNVFHKIVNIGTDKDDRLERFTMAAMQGLLSDPSVTLIPTDMDAEMFGCASIKYAKATIAELDREKDRPHAKVF